MRISDWSSDVCSSDLHRAQAARGDAVAGHGAHDRRPTRRAGARDRGRVMNPASATASLPSADDQGNATATAANAPTPMTGARWLVQALAAEGVDTLFGYPGGAIMPFYDALHGAGLRHILVRHEQGAAFEIGRAHV